LLFFVHFCLSDALEMLDQDPYLDPMNPDPQDWSTPQVLNRTIFHGLGKIGNSLVCHPGPTLTKSATS
jgi:hypothetical protein